MILDLPGVGENLQDHLEVYIQHACTKPVSLYYAVKPFNKVMVGLKWLLFKKGEGTSNHSEAGGFIRSNAEVEYPNLEYHFFPITINYVGATPLKGHGFQAPGPRRPNVFRCTWFGQNHLG